jgi:hypothetical protein
MLVMASSFRLKHAFGCAHLIDRRTGTSWPDFGFSERRSRRVGSAHSLFNRAQ